MDKTTLGDLISCVKQAFADCADFKERNINSGDASIYICFIKGITDRQYISENLIKPILISPEAITSFSGGFEQLLQSATLTQPKDTAQIFSLMLKGEVLIAIEKNGTLYTVLANAEVAPGRSIQEPTSDITVKGPKVGFVEDAEKNMSLLRRFIRNPALKFVTVKAGSFTATGITLAYIEGRADGNVIEQIKSKIENADVATIIDSGNVEALIDTRKVLSYPIVGSSEKVDKVAAKILAGRVGVIVDGSPFVLTAPYVFAESIQSAEDYLRSPFYATFIRVLRFAALIAALYLPALIVTVITSHNELLPKLMVEAIKEMRAKMPFSLFWETFIVLMIFEILREVGVRMPRAAGDAIGIVGSLILGDAAVKAGLASPIVIIAVAMCAVCSFIVPVYMYTTVFFRFIFLFLGFKLGFYGIIMGTIALLFTLCATNSFGASYMSPLAPFNKQGMLDFLIAVPKKTLGRKEKLK